MEIYRERAQQMHNAIREALLREWDPIGISDVPEAQDEYDSYVGNLYKLLIAKRPVHEIFAHLWWIETEHMGLTGDRQATEHFATRLAKIPTELGV